MGMNLTQLEDRPRNRTHSPFEYPNTCAAMLRELLQRISKVGLRYTEICRNWSSRMSSGIEHSRWIYERSKYIYSNEPQIVNLALTVWHTWMVHKTAKCKEKDLSRVCNSNRIFTIPAEETDGESDLSGPRRSTDRNQSIQQ